jgi:ArsR family transcriptional regulator
MEIEKLTDRHIQHIATLLKSMGHPIRYKILCLLQEEEISVGELRNRVDTSNSNISGHLNILRNQGLIAYRKDSNIIYNSLSDQKINELLQKLNSLFGSGN